MAFSPVSGTARRLVRPITAEKSAEKSDDDAHHSEPSTAGTSRPQLRSVSLADVMARQQATNAPSRNVGQDDIGSNDAGGGTPVAGGPISQNFVESFSAAAADPNAFDELLTSIFGGDIDQAQTEGFRQSALEGDFSCLPTGYSTDEQRGCNVAGQDAGATEMDS